MITVNFSSTNISFKPSFVVKPPPASQVLSCLAQVCKDGPDEAFRHWTSPLVVDTHIMHAVYLCPLAIKGISIVELNNPYY